MPVIAMSPELATRGNEIAAALAAQLKLAVIDHEVVEHDIAERAHIPEDRVHRLLEGGASIWERWSVDRQSLSRQTSLEILELAARGNVVIRGWGATHVLKDVDHVVSVRTCAPMAKRIATLMRRLGIDNPSMARREIERSDAAHDDMMRRLFGVEWSDPTVYAITLNTARVPPDVCAAQIAALAGSAAFAETDASRSRLEDLMVLERARAKLDEYAGTSRKGDGFDIEVAGGHLVLGGASTDAKVIAETVRVLQSVEGVRSVESKVMHYSFVPQHG